MGGVSILEKSHLSLSQVLPKIYPEFNWESFKFVVPNSLHWEEIFKSKDIQMYRILMCVFR